MYDAAPNRTVTAVGVTVVVVTAPRPTPPPPEPPPPEPPPPLGSGSASVGPGPTYAEYARSRKLAIWALVVGLSGQKRASGSAAQPSVIPDAARA